MYFKSNLFKIQIKALKEAEINFKNELNINTNRTAADRNMYIESTATVLKTKLNNANITQIDLNKLAVYRNEIKQTRQQRDNEMMLKKNLTEKIIIKIFSFLLIKIYLNQKLTINDYSYCYNNLNVIQFSSSLK